MFKSILSGTETHEPISRAAVRLSQGRMQDWYGCVQTSFKIVKQTVANNDFRWVHSLPMRLERKRKTLSSHNEFGSLKQGWWRKNKGMNRNQADSHHNHRESELQLKYRPMLRTTEALTEFSAQAKHEVFVNYRRKSSSLCMCFWKWLQSSKLSALMFFRTLTDCPNLLKFCNLKVRWDLWSRFAFS